MTMIAVQWGELTSEEVGMAAKGNALVILPLGCTEQHAFHLPVDTDTYQVDRLTVEGSRKAAERYGIRVLVLPAIPYGPAAEHYGFPGTISLPNDVYVRLVKHVLWSVIDSGFHRVATVSGCDGHFALRGALWELKAETRRLGNDVIVRALSVDGDWRQLKQKHFPDTASGHAAVMETALCLAYREHLVRNEKMRAPQLDRFPERYRDEGEVFLFADATDTGGLGDPTPATPEGGRALWEDITDAFARQLKHLEELDLRPSRR